MHYHNSHKNKVSNAIKFETDFRSIYDKHTKTIFHSSEKKLQSFL